MKLISLVALAPALVAGEDEPVEYGADVSWPMQHVEVSTNYPWLEHNVDPSVPVPRKYEDMVPQPLGDRQTFYKDYMQGCLDKNGKKGKRCTQTEIDRIEMTLRQPQSMQNYVSWGSIVSKADADKNRFDISIFRLSLTPFRIRLFFQNYHRRIPVTRVSKYFDTDGTPDIGII